MKPAISIAWSRARRRRRAANLEHLVAVTSKDEVEAVASAST